METTSDKGCPGEGGRRSSLLDPWKSKDEHDHQKRRVRLSIDKKDASDDEALIVSSCRRSSCGDDDAPNADGETGLLEPGFSVRHRSPSEVSDLSERRSDILSHSEEEDASDVMLNMKKTVRLGMLTINNTYMTEFLLTSKMCGNICSEIFGDANRFFQMETVRNPQPKSGTLHIELFHVGKRSIPDERILNPPADSHKFVKPKLYDTVHHDKEEKRSRAKSGGSRFLDPNSSVDAAQFRRNINRYSITNFFENHSQEHDVPEDDDMAEEIEVVGRDFVGLGIRITFSPTIKGPFVVSWLLDIVEVDGKSLENSGETGTEPTTAHSASNLIVGKIELTIQGQCIDKWTGKPLLKVNVHEIAKGLENVSDAETVQAK